MAELEVQIDGRGAKQGAGVVVRSLDRIKAAAKGAAGGLDRTSRAQKKVKRESVGLGRAVGALAGLLAVRKVIDYADAWTQVQNRLKLVTDSQIELNAVTDQVFGIAQRTRNSLEGTAELYQRIARSSEELGISQQEVLDVTESVSQAITISGVSAEAANAAIVQLGQGLASGALRGDELRSVLEQTPRLARAIADGLDVPIGALRELGKEGELTADKVIKALQSQSDVLEEEFGQIGPTIGQGFQTLTNSVTRFIGRFGEASGVFTGAAETLQLIAGGIDDVGDGFFDATFEVAQFVRALAGGLATLDERFAIFKNTVVGTLATIFGDDEVAEAAAADRASLEAELDRQLMVILDALDEERQAYEQLKADRKAAEDFDLSLKPEVDTEEIDEAALKLQMLQGEFNSLAELASGLDINVPSLSEENFGDPEKVAEAIGKLRKSLMDFGMGITEDVMTPMEEYQAEIARLKLAVDGNLISQETYNRAVREAAEAYVETTPEAEAHADALERAAALMEELRTPTEVYRDTILDLADLLMRGYINQETFNRAVQQAQEEFAKAGEEANKMSEFMKSISDEAARSMFRSFSDFLFDPAEDGFDGLARSFAQTLHRMASDALAAAVFKILEDQFASLAQSAGGASGGGWGGFLSGLAGFFGGGFAEGGDFQGGRPILVGEEGPEIITPRASGTVIPNGAMGAAMAPEVNVAGPTIVNTLEDSAIVAAFNRGGGGEVILNQVADNASAFRNALGLN